MSSFFQRYFSQEAVPQLETLVCVPRLSHIVQQRACSSLFCRLFSSLSRKPDPLPSRLQRPLMPVLPSRRCPDSSCLSSSPSSSPVPPLFSLYLPTHNNTTHETSAAAHRDTTAPHSLPSKYTTVAYTVTSKRFSTVGHTQRATDTQQQSFSKVRVYLLALWRRQAKLVAVAAARVFK